MNIDYKSIAQKAEKHSKSNINKTPASKKDIYSMIMTYLSKDLQSVDLQAINDSFSKDLHVLEINLISITEAIDKILEEFNQRLVNLSDDVSDTALKKYSKNIEFILLDLSNLKEEINFLLSNLNINNLAEILAKKKTIEEKCAKLQCQLEAVLQKIG